MQDGSRALREAGALAPEHPDVKAAFYVIQEQQEVNVFLQLCHRFCNDGDVNAGREALRCCKSEKYVFPSGTPESGFRLLLDAKNAADGDTRDGLIAGLLHRCVAVRIDLARRLQKSEAVTFQTVYAIGDGSANGLTAVVLDHEAWRVWSDECSREVCEKDVFQLFVAKLMESGHDHDGRSLKGIARLLAVDAKKLATLMDEETFDTILSSTDVRLDIDVKSQATLAIAKYVEVSGKAGEEMLSRFITSRVSQATSSKLIYAFSAAAAMFPILPSVVAGLLLTEGFVPSLVPLLTKKIMSKTVEQAALEMLSAACIDGACREAISVHLTPWLQEFMRNANDERAGHAAVILAKTKGVTNGQKNLDPQEQHGDGKALLDVVATLQHMYLDGGDVDVRHSIEGLAYSSMQPSVKEKLVADKNFIRKLLESPNVDAAEVTTIFGTLSLLDNLTRYRPALSEEQKRMAQLKAYANASKPATQPDPLDDDDRVSKRCKVLLDAGTVDFLVRLNRFFLTQRPSQTSTNIIASILLSLSTKPETRGIITQQGGISLLILIHEQARNKTKSSATDLALKTQQTAAHALARILISLDPALVFGGGAGSPQVMSAMPPLLSLLNDPSTAENSNTPVFADTNSSRDLLPTFESLLALTNIVSSPDTHPAAGEIIRTSYPVVEDLLLSSNIHLQRAATQLICNLCTMPEGIQQLADGSKGAAKRIHILLALADVEDQGTRQAAGGALAMVTEFEGAAQAILDRRGTSNEGEEGVKGVEALLGLCQDEDAGVVHRGVVCVRNMVVLEGPVGVRAKDAVKEAGGVQTLQQVLRGSKDRAVLEVGVEALKVLMD